MSNRFVISDTHFGHTNSWAKFKRADGTPLRPFNSDEEMDEAMVDRWNAVVQPHDVVYHLGDVVINKKALHHISRLNGSKRLIRGNHDIFDDQMYYDVGFSKIVAYRVFVDEFIFSHIPLHPDCITERFVVNVHGHLHANEITRKVEKLGAWNPTSTQNYDRVMVDEIDPRYMCVSVEHTDYAPVSFEDLKIRIQKRWDETGYVKATKGWGNGGPG